MKAFLNEAVALVAITLFLVLILAWSQIFSALLN